MRVVQIRVSPSFLIPGGGVGDAALSSPCAAPTPQGTVQTVAHVTRECESCSNSNRIQHVWIALSGIELRCRTDAVEEPSDWQELLPSRVLRHLKRAGGDAAGIRATAHGAKQPAVWVRDPPR